MYKYFYDVNIKYVALLFIHFKENEIRCIRKNYLKEYL